MKHWLNVGLNSLFRDYFRIHSRLWEFVPGWIIRSQQGAEGQKTPVLQ